MVHFCGLSLGLNAGSNCSRAAILSGKFASTDPISYTLDKRVQRHSSIRAQRSACTNLRLLGEDVMGTTRGFWQHANGKIYAIESDTFGKILGAAGPLDPNDLRDLDDYDYRPAITGWVADALARRALHRINPSSCCR